MKEIIETEQFTKHGTWEVKEQVQDYEEVLHPDDGSSVLRTVPKQSLTRWNIRVIMSLSGCWMPILFAKWMLTQSLATSIQFPTW